MKCQEAEQFQPLEEPYNVMIWDATIFCHRRQSLLCRNTTALLITETSAFNLATLPKWNRRQRPAPW